MPRYFFDTSALVKHYHAEAGTDFVDRVIAQVDAELLIARLTPFRRNRRRASPRQSMMWI
jgi:hypothetical protein